MKKTILLILLSILSTHKLYAGDCDPITRDDVFEMAKTGFGDGLCYEWDRFTLEPYMNERDNKGKTLLMIASENGHHENVRKILEWGAKFHEKDYNNNTAISLAAKNGHFLTYYVIYRKITRKKNNKYLNFMKSIYDGDKKMVIKMANSGININEKIKKLKNVSTRDFNKIKDCPPLFVAISRGHIEIYEYLLRKGARTLSQNQLNKALCNNFETYRKNKRAIKELISKGACLIQEDMHNYDRPIIFSILKYEGIKTFESYIKKHVKDINAKYDGKNTIFDYAITNGYRPKVINILINKGAIVKDSHLTSAILNRTQNIETAELLIKNGTKTDKINKSGENAISLASKHSSLELYRFLLKHTKEKESYSIANEIINKGNHRFLEFKLEETDLHSVPSKELRIIRNTIFAKYNYSFKSKDLQEHFSQFQWYNPDDEDTNRRLTEIEKENIKLIKNLEKDRK